MDAGSSVSDIVGEDAGKWPSAFVGLVGSEKACDGLKRMAEFHYAGTCNPCYYHLNMQGGCKMEIGVILVIIHTHVGKTA